MDSALELLYGGGMLTLAAGDDKEGEGVPEFDSEVWRRACEWIRSSGEFTPEMLREKPVREVIDETFRILGGAVSQGIPTEMPEDLAAILQNNTFIFSGLKSFHSLSEVGLSLVDEKGGGIKPLSEFQKDVERIDAKYNRNYLRAEYNHAVASSQMATRWREFEQTADRYDLQYRTADDGKVRAEHQPLHNITLPADDPFWESYFPPNGWGCRCTAVQVLRGKYPTSDPVAALAAGEGCTSKPSQKMFRFNPGKELKVFPDKHPYNKAPEEVKNTVGEIARVRFSAKTIREAESRFKDSLGVNCRLDGFKKKDIRQVGDIFDCVEKHFRDFPQLKEKVKFVGSMTGRVNHLIEAKSKELKRMYPHLPDSMLKGVATKWARKIAYVKDCYAYSSEGGEEYGANGLVFNTAWAGEQILGSLKRDVDNKFHPIGCDSVKSVFDHELGHKIDALLNLKSDSAFLSIYNKAVAGGEQFITDNLSRYAYDKQRMGKQNYLSEAEFIAEAWSEYLNNPNAREIATDVGRLIEKKCAELKK